MGKRIAWSILGLLAAGLALSAAEPVASVGTNWSGIELDLMSVERRGNILTVKWAVRNASASRQNPRFALTGKQVDTYVVDEENGTKYYALTDQEGHALASSHVYLGSDSYGIDAQVEPGATNRYWAKFPAPPPEVTSVSIFFTQSEPIEGVAITEK